ncbi:MAG TPA: hypothetical protein VEX41_07295 [Candidatus Eisenbacteria bacterium]|nr:hypothetical protein [Candidatus Eisenbacteria bacterium]
MFRLVSTLAMLVVLTVACTSNPSAAPLAPLGTSSPSPTGNLASSGPPSPSPTPRPAVEFADGTYTVGVDLAAGTYRLREPAPACHWARVSGFGGTLADDIAFANVTGFAVVEISPTDKGFRSEQCGTWSSDLSAVIPGPPFGDGTYIVGADLQPGTFRSDGTGQCLWQRLSGFGGTLDEVVDGEVVSGPATATIQPGDVGFRAFGCGTWNPD